MPIPEGVRGELNQNISMRKIFLYAMIAFIGIALMSCDKDKNNAEDPTTDNPYPYLRVDDLMPLHSLPIAQAETAINKMGYKGGWQQKGNETFYLYVSDSKNDSIFLEVDSEGIVNTVSYQASKGIIPSDAKGWLSHIPEKVALPEKISKLTQINELPFFVAGLETPNDGKAYYTYQEYIKGLQNLSSGMEIIAQWGSGPVPNEYPSGYYGGITMLYSYRNGKDQAILMLYSFYHEQKEDKPIDPIMPGDE